MSFQDNGKDNKNTKESSQQKTFYPYYPYPPYYGEPLGNNPSPSTQFYQPPPPMVCMQSCILGPFSTNVGADKELFC